MFQSTRFPEEIDVTICSLEDPELVRPKDHTFASSRLSWDVIDDGLPVFPAERKRR
jgi:hypothetical protein